MSVMMEQKRSALAAAVSSRIFSRAHRLRAVLQYVCEEELEGRGPEITERKIGIQVLGRPDDFSPSEDSIVRTQVHVLRKKLEELYAMELPDAGLRIEFEKGSYRPRFVETCPAAVPAVEAHAVRRWARIPRLSPAGGFFAGLAVSAAVAGIGFVMHGSTTGVPSVLKDAWGPVFDKSSSALLCVGAPVNLWVCDFGDTPPAFPSNILEMPDLPVVTNYYDRMSERSTAGKLYLQPHHDGVLFGESAAVAVVALTLSRAGVPVQIIPESRAAASEMQNSNLVIFGKPEFSPAIRALMRKGLFDISSSSRDGGYSIVEKPTEKYHPISIAPRREYTGAEREEYGIVTVLPTQGSGGRGRTVAFSGIGAGSVWGAAEFLCSEESLTLLKRRLRTEGYSRWPASYQVLVRVITNRGLPVKFQYATHRVLNGSSSQVPPLLQAADTPAFEVKRTLAVVDR